MKIKFMSSKDGGESQSMYPNSDNKEIMIGVDPDEIIGQLFNLTLLHRYQKKRFGTIYEGQRFCV